MRKVLLLAILGLLCISLSSLAGEVVTNDTGEDATGLRVVFSMPVEITAFGDILMHVDQDGAAQEFIFSGGTVAAWGTHWMSWTPSSAQILSYEWLKDVPSTPEKQWIMPQGGTGWVAEYTEIFFDDFDTEAPGLTSGLVLLDIGALTGDNIEPIAGQCSVIGRYNGSEHYRAYLRSSPSVLPLTPKHCYTVTFDYRILEAPDKGFEIMFYSPQGGRAGHWLPSINIAGQVGDTGRAKLTNDLLDYADYEVRWNVVSKGAIAVDNIELIDVTEGETVLIEDCEGLGPAVRSELHFLADGVAAVTDDPEYAIEGYASVILTNLGAIVTDPELLLLPGGYTYIVEFDYESINGGAYGKQVEVWLQLAGRVPWSVSTSAQLPFMFNHEPEQGTYQGGITVPSTGGYYLIIRAVQGASIAIDNLRILRQDVVVSEAFPQHWNAIADAPFPRLGNYLMGTTQAMAYGDVEGTRFMYSVSDIEQRASLSDVIVGFTRFQQTRDPAFAKRLRELNPNILLLPYLIAGEEALEKQEANWGRKDAGVEIIEEYIDGIADEWIVKTVDGKDAADLAWTFISKLNIYNTCPVVNGQTFNDYLANHILEDVVASGVWDGIYIDNLFARINPHITNGSNRDLLDFDINNNGLRDETPAQISDQTRAAAIELLSSIRQETGAHTLIIGNTGPQPQLALAPYVNGFLFECFNVAWCYECGGAPSEVGWRRALDDYLYMNEHVQWPAVNIVEGCGVTGTYVEPDRAYPSPRPEDYQKHRLTMGTALLGNGFYEYDLFEGRSAPYWFDEYTVNSAGQAIEDPAFKGYLGKALADAEELRSAERMVWEQSFERSSYPQDMWHAPGAQITRKEGEVIDGGGSLLLSNQGDYSRQYTNAGTNYIRVRLNKGETYVIEADWKIVDTLDSYASISVLGEGFQAKDYFLTHEIVRGDSGTARFPVTLDAGKDFYLVFLIGAGGGAIAFDNVRIVEGGAGPWRRDFENGFVLVNPLPEPHIFTERELRGRFDRTGIHRIDGTQDPSINNGEPVVDELTLAPFDAIILLADRIPAD